MRPAARTVAVLQGTNAGKFEDENAVMRTLHYEHRTMIFSMHDEE